MGPTASPSHPLSLRMGPTASPSLPSSLRMGPTASPSLPSSLRMGPTASPSLPLSLRMGPTASPSLPLSLRMGPTASPSLPLSLQSAWKQPFPSENPVNHGISRHFPPHNPAPRLSTRLAYPNLRPFPHPARAESVKFLLPKPPLPRAPSKPLTRDHLHEAFRPHASRYPHFYCPIPRAAPKPTPMDTSTHDIPTNPSPIKAEHKHKDLCGSW
jgi:hypothetical protein